MTPELLTAPLSTLTLRQKQDLIFEHEIKVSPLIWAKTFVSHWVPLPYADMHFEWEALAESNKRLAIAAPRYHSKTMLFCKVMPAWVALEKPNSVVYIFGASEDMAVESVRKIKAELEANQYIHRVYGKQETSKWTESEIVLSNGSIIKGLGAEGVVRGRHPTHAFLDDLENDEMVLSESRRKYFEDWFFEVLIGTLSAEAKLVLLGTILHINSFLAKIIKTPPASWESKLYSEPEKPETAAEADLLWPQSWPRQALIDRKAEIGSLRYLKEYCNNPLSDEAAIYKEPWMQEYSILPCPEDNLFIVGGVDIGCRQREMNDFSALVVYGRVQSGPKEGHIYCLDAVRGHWTVYELVTEMMERQRRWPQMRWAIETVQAQYAILQVFKQEAYRNGLGYVQVDDFQVKQDKVLRASSNTPIFEQGWVHFRPNQRAFVDELLIFPQGEHKDWVDANSMAMLPLQRSFYTKAPKEPEEPKPQTWGDMKRQLFDYQKVKAKYPRMNDVHAWWMAA